MLYQLDDQFPPELQDKTLEERIEWHRQRVERKKPVFEFFDWLHHDDLDDEELLTELEAVKLELRRLDVQIQLRENPELGTLRGRLDRAVSSLSYTVGQLREEHWQEAETCESRIREICEEIGTSAQPLLRLHAYQRTVSI